MNHARSPQQRHSLFLPTLSTCTVLVGLGLVLRSEAGEPHPGAEKRSTFVAFDDFDGKPMLRWKPVRHDPTHVSFTKHPGSLTITTQRGTIHRDEGNDDPNETIKAKNIFLIDNPLAPDADFVVTTCVSGFTPQTTYQQAGLVLYHDDDNYLKWGYEYNWPNRGGQAFCILSETDANSRFTYVDSPSGLDRYWVRLTKRGNTYEYSFSTDGNTFTVRGEREWSDGGPKRLGLLAKNGGSGDPNAGELDARFEFFELRSPIPAEAQPEPAPPVRRGCIPCCGKRRSPATSAPATRAGQILVPLGGSPHVVRPVLRELDDLRFGGGGPLHLSGSRDDAPRDGQQADHGAPR